MFQQALNPKASRASVLLEKTEGSMGGTEGVEYLPVRYMYGRTRCFRLGKDGMQPESLR